jgi:FtsP/CotA-like multicopper oxidase with cupredoxin domain
MQSRRGFVKSFLGTTATLALARKFAKASAQKAALATAQFRESGTNAKLLIHPLRNNVSMISGSGGNVLVLPGGPTASWW